MGLFDRFQGGRQQPMGAQPQAPQPPDPAQMLQELRADPSGTLAHNTRFNIPAGMSSPEEIQQHLLQTRQITPAQYQRAVAIAQTLMHR